MDLKNILKDNEESGVKQTAVGIDKKVSEVSETSENIRVHKKPIQLRDIENRSANNMLEKQNESDESMRKLLNKEKKDSFKKPWNKLDNGMKLNRLKNYIQNEKLKNELNDDETQCLSKLLHGAYKNSKLNKNNDVIYNIETCEIESIKELIYNSDDKQYILKIKEVKKGKNASKSRSNIDRFLKR